MSPSPDGRWSERLDRRLHDRLVAVADPSRVPAMRAYMKDQFAFLGVTGTERDAVLREALTDLGPPPDHDELVAAVDLLWARPEREHQYAACRLLRRWATLLEPADVAWLGGLITTRSWWDTVDELAQHPVGSLVRAHPELSAVMDEWIDSPDRWLARTAILHQNRWKAATDPDRLFAYARRRAGDTDFFIRKAIGWALRQYAYTDADAVRSFVLDHEQELSGLTVREALKNIGRLPR